LSIFVSKEYNMVVAVTAASGQLGRAVVRSLLEKNVPGSQIVAVVRDPARVADLGVGVRVGDYNDRAALVDAFAGVDKVLLISGTAGFGTRAVEHANVVTAAKISHVKHIAYTSILHADQWGLPIAADHQETEDFIRISGLPYTILRNGWYWTNHTAGLPSALRYGVLIGCGGTGRVSWASRRDLAEAAATVLTGVGHDGNTYELAGDRSHTLAELAAEVARQSGKPFAYVDVSEAELAAFYKTFGMATDLAKILAETEAKGLRQNILSDDTGTLSKLIDRPTTTIEQAVAEIFVQNPVRF
jgi:NAD(P)H dehydrogenase (quinone)